MLVIGIIQLQRIRRLQKVFHRCFSNKKIICSVINVHSILYVNESIFEQDYLVNVKTFNYKELYGNPQDSAVPFHNTILMINLPIKIQIGKMFTLFLVNLNQIHICMFCNIKFFIHFLQICRRIYQAYFFCHHTKALQNQ